MIDLATGGLLIAAHVVERWRERVADVSPAAALAAIESFSRSGLVVDEAPDWILESEVKEARRYVLNEAVPDVALAAREHVDGLTLITVITRRPWRPARERESQRPPRSRSYEARRRRRLLFASLKQEV